MGSREFWFIAACYLACVLRIGVASGGPTLAKVFASINGASRSDAQMPDRTGDARAERSIVTGAGPRITLKDDDLPETPRESPLVKDRSARAETSSGARNESCSRYCIQLGNGEDRLVEDTNVHWSFAEGERDNFSLENSSKLKVSRQPVVNKNLTILDNGCQIYLNLGCDIVSDTGRNLIRQRDKFDSNLESNRPRAEIFRNSFSRTSPRFFSKKLARRTNLNGHTETKFHVDADVTEIVIDILGNLTRAILSIPTNRTTRTRTAITTLSLARTYDAKGVTVIGARNPPPGGWRVKLTGVQDSKYNLDVVARYGAGEENDTRGEIVDIGSTDEFGDGEVSERTLKRGRRAEETTAVINGTKPFRKLEKKAGKNVADNRIEPIPVMNSGIRKMPKFVFERSVEMTNARSNSDETTTQNAPSDRVIFNERMVVQRQQLRSRSSEVASLNEDVDTNVKSFASNNVSLQMMDSGDNKNSQQELSAKLTESDREDIFRGKRMAVEVNVNSNLIATPGRIHRVLFDVTNNCVLMVIYRLRATSSPFRVYNVQPMFMWLSPGQTKQVAVDIVIPAGTGQNTVNTITLSVVGTQISEKTVYVYVQDAFSKIIDDVKPTIEYSFNNNCAGKLNRDRCDRTYWSADVTVQDFDSGLKRVTSTPNEIYPRAEFISGTKDRVTFHYVSTCCSTTARITAIDLANNQYSRTIDVTAWDNLSEGEIAAITLGALLLLFLLILIIIAIVYCLRRRNGHDLPYTQRYGSRPPARSERTSF